MNRIPTATIAATIKDPADAADAIKRASAKTVSVAVSPILYLLQEAGLRTSAGVAGAIEPPIEYAQGRFHGDLPDVLRQSGSGLAAGVLRKEAPKGGPPATATSDVMKRAGYTQGFYRDLPFAQARGYGHILRGMAFGAGEMRGEAKVADWLTGPDAAGMASEIAASEGLNAAAKGTGWVINKTPIPEGISRVGDKARNLPVARNFVDAFSNMGLGRVQRKVVDPSTGEVVAENAREGLRQAVREMVGERGNLVSRFRAQIAGGEEAIYEGATKYGMTPIERSKYLETLREGAPRKGRFTFDDYVQEGTITPREGDYLTRVQEFLDEMVPSARTSRGLKAARLYATAARSAEKATAAVNRVEKLAEEGRQMLLHERVKHGVLDPTGNPITLSGLGTRMGLNERERLRRELIKAVTDADFAVRSFGRASRHKMTQLDFDRKNAWTYTLEELLGFTEQLTKKELGDLGMTQFDRAFLPVRSAARMVVRRRGTPGLPQGFEARAFDKYGNEIWRSPVTDTSNKALEEGRRVLGQGTEFVTQDMQWASDKRVRGPKASPIPGLSAQGKQIRDYERIFVNYLPRYEGEEILAKTRQLKAGKKTGISTGFGGVRVSAPTTTQEEARDLIRRAYVRRAAEQKVSGKVEPIEEPLQSLTEALETHASRNASAVSKAAFLGKAGKNFGVFTEDPVRVSQLRMDGWLPIGKLKGATSGMDEYLRRQMLNTYVPESVFNGLSAIDRVMQPADRAGVSKLFHSVLQAEKTYLTTVNPRFSMRNRLWELMVSYARGNSNPSNWVDATKLLAGKFNGKRVPGFDLTGEELVSLLRREGVLGEGISREVATRGGAFRNRTGDLFLPARTAQGSVREPSAREIAKSLMGGAARKLQKGVQWAGDVNQEGENLSRVAHWLWAMRDRKMGNVAARLEVGTTMFDYSRDFYTISEAQLKEWIPFYSWYRRIVPLTLRMVGERPGEFTKMGALMTHINALNGISPEEMQYMGRTYLNGVGIVLPDDRHQPAGTKRGLSIPFGFSDPGQFMQLSPELSETAPGGALTGAIRGVAGAFRPELQLIPAFIYAQSPTGEKYTGEIVKLPSVLLALPADVRERLNIRVVDGVPMGPSTMIPLTRYLEGGWGEALGGAISQNPRARARFMSWLSGFTLDPEIPVEQYRMGEAIGKVSEMREKIGRLRRAGRRITQAQLRALEREKARADTTGAAP